MAHSSLTEEPVRELYSGLHPTSPNFSSRCPSSSLGHRSDSLLWSLRCPSRGRGLGGSSLRCGRCPSAWLSLGRYHCLASECARPEFRPCLAQVNWPHLLAVWL